MIGHRTRYSLAQLLEQQDPAIVVTLLRKHGAPISVNPGSLVYELINAVRGLGDRQVMDVLAEVVATALAVEEQADDVVGKVVATYHQATGTLGR